MVLLIDAKEFHKLQTLYLQLMTHVRNIDRKMKVQTEESFFATLMLLFWRVYPMTISKRKHISML